MYYRVIALAQSDLHIKITQKILINMGENPWENNYS